jgi:O-methyltransferase
MTALTRHVDRALVDAYDFGRFGTIVDVGGNRGALLAAILREHPEVRGVLFDQGHVVAGAPALLGEAGVADRVRIEAGSFFEAVPEGGDAYLLKSIVHDWEDAEAEAILRVVRAAMPADGALLVVERVIAPPNEGRDGKFSDLNMLVMPGGRERTLDEYAALFERSGFELVREAPSAAGASVVEGRPRP